MGLPFLIDKLLGAVPALIVAAICNGPTDPDTKKVLINCKDRNFPLGEGVALDRFPSFSINGD